MINTHLLVKLLLQYNVPYDLILKIIIQWDICFRKPLETIMNNCFSEIHNPILLVNGGTRWDYRTDFYHSGWQQKKRNGLDLLRYYFQTQLLFIVKEIQKMFVFLFIKIFLQIKN